MPSRVVKDIFSHLGPTICVSIILEVTYRTKTIHQKLLPSKDIGKISNMSLILFLDHNVIIQLHFYNWVLPKKSWISECKS